MSGFAYADADAGGAAERSPGLLSGNLVQLPVHTPVNVCGNTVSVIGLLNPAAGNRCANGQPGPSQPSSEPSHPAKPGTANGGGAHAAAGGKDSPGVLSGNGIQLPVDLPLNVSGNSVSVVGVGNGTGGNTSVNGTPSSPKPSQPSQPTRPTESSRPAVPSQPAAAGRPLTPAAPPQHGPALAHTGAEGVGYLLPGGGALLLGGMLLYRRFRLG
ncbi:chaplin family protein [Streptomyces sp. NPDC044571]|uniref:chaplin family protein n=1 Tax=Streptomyces sp. NPDC044571 TaxID=3155371 RepID=UPI0033CFDB85